MATRSLKGVEIFRAGTWKGKPYTLADLDDIVANFKRFQSGAGRLQRAPVVVGHDQKDLANSSVAKRGEITQETALEYANDLAYMANSLDRFFQTGQISNLEDLANYYDKAVRDRERWANIVAAGYPFRIIL